MNTIRKTGISRGQSVETGGRWKRRPVIKQQLAAELPSRVEVWFDGSCPLCRHEITLMQRLDRAGRIRFIDLSSPDADCPLDPATMLVRFHAREGGVILSGAAAFAAMWRAIPMLRPLGLAARLPGIAKLLEWLYIRFLSVRPRLQAYFR